MLMTSMSDNKSCVKSRRSEKSVGIEYAKHRKSVGRGTPPTAIRGGGVTMTTPPTKSTPKVTLSNLKPYIKTTQNLTLSRIKQ